MEYSLKKECKSLCFVGAVVSSLLATAAQNPEKTSLEQASCFLKTPRPTPHPLPFWPTRLLSSMFTNDLAPDSSMVTLRVLLNAVTRKTGCDRTTPGPQSHSAAEETDVREKEIIFHSSQPETLLAPTGSFSESRPLRYTNQLRQYSIGVRSSLIIPKTTPLLCGPLVWLKMASCHKSGLLEERKELMAHQQG